MEGLSLPGALADDVTSRDRVAIDSVSEWRAGCDQRHGGSVRASESDLSLP